MDKQRLPLLGYAAAILAVAIIGFVFFTVMKDPEVDFCRRALAALINGNELVQDSIDWVSFQAVGTDVRLEYLKLPNEKERSFFRKSFIINLSLSFKNAGGQFKAFTNWRVYSRNRDQIIIASDTPNNQTMLFTISKKFGKIKLTRIDWRK